jgi:hypothetical protein
LGFALADDLLVLFKLALQVLELLEDVELLLIDDPLGDFL